AHEKMEKRAHAQNHKDLGLGQNAQFLFHDQRPPGMASKRAIVMAVGAGIHGHQAASSSVGAGALMAFMNTSAKLLFAGSIRRIWVPASRAAMKRRALLCPSGTSRSSRSSFWRTHCPPRAERAARKPSMPP